MTTVGVIAVVAAVFLGYEALKLFRPSAAGATSPAASGSGAGGATTSGAAPSSGTTQTLSPAQLDSTLAEALQLTGQPQSWASDLRTLLSRYENAQYAYAGPGAKNPNSTASGLFQTLTSTFSSYALPGHTDIWSPVDNTIAAVRYIAERYGSPGGALAHERQYGWY